jgi:asparagine synthase (glutamine-hydrolysing)
VSGIVAVYHLDRRPVCRKDLEGMSLILAHRGPDGAGLWSEGAVGLGHRMLWTTQESLGERLPMVSKNGRFVLTADARIDNRPEVLAALGLTDRPDGKVSDSALILAAYEIWGVRCPERLLGDFAFVLWDRHQQTLFCARDHFGVKPLYYYYRPGHLFACASEIKALLCLPEVPRVADPLHPVLPQPALR